LFDFALDPFEPPDVPSVYHVRGQRIRVTPGEKVEWPYDLTAEERALGLDGMRQKCIWSILSEVGDVTDPTWPLPETLKKYDQMNRSDFWRSREVNRIGFIGGPIPREDGPDAQTQQVLSRAA